MSRAKVIASASVFMYVNGKPYGRCQAFSFTSTTQKKPIMGIDSLDPYELATTHNIISGNIQILRTVGDGGAEGSGMTVSFEDLSREKYFSLMLVDRGAQDSIIFQADACSLNRQSWNIVNKGIMTGSLEFEALTWSNDVKPLGISFSG
jgi:hypothetical protein